MDISALPHSFIDKDQRHSITVAFNSPLANERINPMSDTFIGLDHAEAEILTYEVSDEALETAGDTENGNAGITLTFCTWTIGCPA